MTESHEKAHNRGCRWRCTLCRRLRVLARLWRAIGADGADAGARRTCRRGEAPGLRCADRHDWYRHVVAYNVVDVHAQVTGTIEQIGFVEGQVVHPNSLIAQLDQRPFQAALQQAEANLARDQANLTNAQAQSRALHAVAEAGVCIGTAGHRPGVDGDAARGFRRWRQGSDLQCADAARLHDDHLTDRWRDRYRRTSTSATSSSRAPPRRS